MQILIEAQGLGYQRSGALVFQPIDLQLAAGDAVLVTGTNGSGKTTLLRLLAGILRPSQGRLARNVGCAFIGHQAALKADLTCLENLRFQQAFYSGQTIASVLDPLAALREVGLLSLMRRRARSLSAGQKKRLGLAGLLVCQPPLWLLDEPYASLDQIGAECVDRLLNQHLAQGGAAILSTHRRRPALNFPITECVVEAAEPKP